ncbi:decapentaplegic [Carabus blaptoides fortunei]
MKIWHCAFVSLALLIGVWLFSVGIVRNKEVNRKTAIEVNIVENNCMEDPMVNDTTKSVFVKGKVKQHVPKFMLDLYKNSKSVRKNDMQKSAPDIVRSVVPMHGETVYPFLLQEETNNINHMLIFNLPNSNIDETFVQAELRVLTLIEIKSRLTLGIERQIKISLYNETTSDMQILEEKHIFHSDNTWISFNVSRAVQSILTHSSPRNLVLKLVITIKSFIPYIDSKIGIFKLSLMPVVDNFEHDYPILLLFYVTTKTEKTMKKPSKLIVGQNLTRKRRYIDEDYEEATNKLWEDDIANKASVRRIKKMRNTCKRKPLYIDFAEIHYDSWIVQPSGYEAYQCTGKCFYPVADHLSPTKHAIVQTLLHSVAPSRTPRSCCVPTKLESISILYVDDQGVLTYRYGYGDMVVAECGCR